ncbi:hypothetical protein INR49_004552, partial [Caranx melampygus]
MLSDCSLSEDLWQLKVETGWYSACNAALTFLPISTVQEPLLDHRKRACCASCRERNYNALNDVQQENGAAMQKKRGDHQGE